MREHIEIPNEKWPSVAAVLGQSHQPWPEAAIQADWAWLQGQVTVGTLRTVPGRLSLAKRWGWRENRVRRFLEGAAAPLADGSAALSHRSGMGDVRVASRGPAQEAPAPHPAATRTSPGSSVVNTGNISDLNRVTPSSHPTTTSAPPVHPMGTSSSPGSTSVSPQKIKTLDAQLTSVPPASHQGATRSHPGQAQRLVNSGGSSENARASGTVNTRNVSAIPSTPIAEAFSSRVECGAVSGTQVDLLSSLTARSINTAIELERAREERMLANVDSPLAPAVREFLRVLKRWSGDEAPADRRWRIKPAEDVDWFMLEIVPTPEAATLDLFAALKDWDEYLERTARATSANDQLKFPRIWKTALRKQIQLKAAWEAKHKKDPKHGKTATSASAKSDANRPTGRESLAAYYAEQRRKWSADQESSVPTRNGKPLGKGAFERVVIRAPRPAPGQSGAGSVAQRVGSWPTG